MIRAKLAAWLSGGERGGRSALRPEDAGGGDADPGLRLLLGDPGRLRIHDEIRERLPGLSRAEKDDLVSGTLGRFLLLVFDLPASARHHHARPFGLLDHTLEIALRVARELSGALVPISPDPVIQHREGPLWALAGVLGALAHDLGKLLDLEIHAPGSPETWDPFREPLHAFLCRHGLRRSDPALYHWKPGRAQAGHEEAAARLLPLILSPNAERVLGTRLRSVVQALTCPTRFGLTPGLSEPAKLVAAAIRRLDQCSAMEDAPPAPPQDSAPPGASRPGRPVPAPGTQEILGYRPPDDPVQAQAREEAEDEAAARRLLPRSREGKRDPAECARRLGQVLLPGRYLEILRQMIVSRRLSRNGFQSDCYLDASFVYLAFPRAFARVHRIHRLPWGDPEREAVLRFLATHPQVEPAGGDQVPVLLRPRPDVGFLQAVRFRREGLLAPHEAEMLGLHAFPLVPVAPEAA